MKERTAHIIVKRKVLIALLSSYIVFNCFTSKTIAQGWSFTFQIYATGNCGGVQPPAVTLPHLGLPTKSQCESLRQQVLAIKASVGGCTVGYTCTACTGSDIVTPGPGGTGGLGGSSGQGAAGEVSFDGLFEGKPLFTPHQSSAFEDWARDYRQQLESYGITSILGKNITPNQIPEIPLTGDIGVDTTYAKLAAGFSPDLDASVVDLRGKQGVVDLSDNLANSENTVPLTRTGEDVLKENEWYYKNYGEMKVITEEGIDESTPSTTDLSDSKEYKIAEAYLDRIGDIPLGELPAYTGKLMLSTVNETFKFLNDATINGKYSAEELMKINPVKLIYNNVTIGQVEGRMEEIASKVGEKTGIAFMSKKFGEAGKAVTELGIKLGKDSQTVLDVIKAKWYNKK